MSENKNPANNKELHWLVRPKTIRGLWVGGCALLAAIIAVSAYAHPHVQFGIEGTFGFFAWYGFITCVAMIIGAKVLGFALKRKDTFYDD